MPKRARAGQATLPDDANIAAQRQALPHFDPYDTRQLLVDAEARVKAAGSTGKRVSIDEAVIQAHKRLQALQIDELTQAMGLDPSSPNFWRDAFVRLASVDHNVGRLIHKWTPGEKNIKSAPSKTWKQIYVRRIDALSEVRGKRETFRLLARMQLVRGEWQLQSKVESCEDARTSAYRARADVFQQTYYRAKRDNAPPIESAKERTEPESAQKPAGLLFMSNFETLLFNIEHPSEVVTIDAQETAAVTT
jgi:hypothetical protein